jgi:uncharacterized membrane protein
MLSDFHIGLFNTADLAALTYLIVAYALFGWVTEHPPADWPSVSSLMAAYRREWMRQMVTRNPRIFDSGAIDSLRTGTTFFASACMITIGGILAVIGSPERLVGVAEALTEATAATIVWQIKLMIVLFFIINAFLKFVWSHRLFGYCLVVMAAVPNELDDPASYPRAAQAAEINISANRAFNKGLNSIYFALGALAFLVSPLSLALATTVTLLLLIRREFLSHSRTVLMQGTLK